MNISKVHFDRNAGQHHAAHEEHGVSRRDVLGALLAATTLAAVWTAPAAAQALKAAGASAAANTAQALTATELATLTAAAETIIPATDTPGATEAGVPQFVAAMVASWMTADEAAFFRKGLADLDAAAQQRHGRAFTACSAEQGADVLQALRTASPYGGRTFSLTDRILDPKSPFYLRLRDLVVLGYFTSEVGSNRELRYMPVPGKFESNVDIKTWPYQVVI